LILTAKFHSLHAKESESEILEKPESGVGVGNFELNLNLNLLTNNQ